jgi:uncharacterized protein (DUF488 family)
LVHRIRRGATARSADTPTTWTTAEFTVAAERLAELARDERVAVMCAEGAWWRCHRSMIADYFKVREWEVLDILGLGDAKEHPYTSVARIVHSRLTY